MYAYALCFFRDCATIAIIYSYSVLVDSCGCEHGFLWIFSGNASFLLPPPHSLRALSCFWGGEGRDALLLRTYVKGSAVCLLFV